VDEFRTLAGSFPVESGDVLLYLDPRALDVPSGHGEVVVADNRWELRQLVELRVRHREITETPLLIHVQITEIRSRADLPWDLAELPAVSLNPSLPDDLAHDLLSLPGPVATALVGSGSLDDKLWAAARILTSRPWPPIAEEAMVSVLRLLPGTTPALRRALLASCPRSKAREVLASDDPATTIQQMREGADPAAEFRAAMPELDALKAAGFVASSRHGKDVGKLSTIETRLEGLLAASLLHRTLDGWIETAWDWAEVRCDLAASDLSNPALPDHESKAWDAWARVDQLWLEWLQASYGRELTKSTLTGVHGVARFLADETARTGARSLLLVLDGLALSQWIQIRSDASLNPISEGAIMAALPTVTSVSRQAILSGTLPLHFAQTIDRTDTEGKAWQRFWSEYSSLDSAGVSYYRTSGRTGDDWVDPPPDSVVSAVVVNAIDEMMHGAGVNGDHQLSASVRTWVAGGFLNAALSWAARSGTHLWMTADHGNLPALGLESHVPSDGVVSTRGQRTRRFSSLAARDQSDLPGISWTPPGYPPSAGEVLFASGRSCFQRSGIAVTHGGLSIDEVIVPFVRLA
jgi:hypothetical protein